MNTYRSAWLLAATVVLAMPGIASATVVTPVPEINMNAVSGGLALLTGSILLLRSWRRR
jgi:hypothetical protein